MTRHRPATSDGGAQNYVAIDIGASSGRVMLGHLEGEEGAERVVLTTIHRFPNGVVEDGGTLSWDLDGLHAEVLRGLAMAAARTATEGGRISSIGIDTWAVDYGLLHDGQLVAPPRAYRDPRGKAGAEAVHAVVSFEELYAITGLQFLPFNTLYQLAAEADLAGKRALLIPDLLAYLLTGAQRTEETNASTTGLLDAHTGQFSTELLGRLGLPAELFAPLISPGETYGELLPEVASATGLDPRTRVVAVGSHDTASAIAAIPVVGGPSFAYISSGTWSLAGVELRAPVTTPESRRANFTNERGVDATVRYLRNTGGLWLLQESLREWEVDGPDAGDLAALLAAAAALPAGGPRFDAGSDEFLAPGGMPERIRAAVQRGTPGDIRLGAEPAVVVRCIMDSLAEGYATVLKDAARLGGIEPSTLHIVGGGSQNNLLCQLTADATGWPVVAGPVEATALGNILIQARPFAGTGETLSDVRAVVARSVQTTTYVPRRGRDPVQDMGG